MAQKHYLVLNDEEVKKLYEKYKVNRLKDVKCKILLEKEDDS